MLFSSSRQLLVILILFSAALFAWNLQLDLWTDVAFYVAASQRLLAGGKLYVDIIDMNTPLAFFLVYPPVKIAQLIAVDAMLAFRVWVFALVWISTGLFWFILRRMRFEPHVTLQIVFVLFLMLIIAPGTVFGQREHLSLILILPYLVLAAGRLVDCKVPMWLAVLVGISAGLGIGVKPNFVFIPIVVELGVIVWQGRLFAAWRTETVTIGALLVGYLLGAWVLFPEYFQTIIPLSASSYSRFSKTWLEVIAEGKVLFSLFFIGLTLLVIRQRLKDHPLIVILMLAAMGFLLSFISQMKGFYYHIYPAQALAGAGLLISLMTVAPRFRDRIWPKIFALALVVAPFILLHASYFVSTQNRRQTEARLLEFIEPARSVAVFSYDIRLSFPFVMLNQKKWSSSFPGLWPLLQVNDAIKAGFPLSERLQRSYDFVNDKVVSDLAAYRPDVVVVDKRKGSDFLRGRQVDYLGLLSASPQFVAAWRHYRLSEDLGTLEIWRRIGAEDEQ